MEESRKQYLDQTKLRQAHGKDRLIAYQKFFQVSFTVIFSYSIYPVILIKAHRTSGTFTSSNRYCYLQVG